MTAVDDILFIIYFCIKLTWIWMGHWKSVELSDFFSLNIGQILTNSLHLHFKDVCCCDGPLNSTNPAPHSSCEILVRFTSHTDSWINSNLHCIKAIGVVSYNIVEG